MILRTPSFYKDFKCIAGACPDSCCQGWEVDADEKSLEYYKTLSGEIRQKIKDGEDFSSLVPKKVYDYIIKRRIYNV